MANFIHEAKDRITQIERVIRTVLVQMETCTLYVCLYVPCLVYVWSTQKKASFVLLGYARKNVLASAHLILT